MSKIHEALKKAQHEQKSASRTTRAKTSTSSLASSVVLSPPLDEVVAGIPRSEWRPQPSGLLLFANHKQTPHLEAFRRLRSQLHSYARTGVLRTVLVTSAIPNEGKTFVTANLGIILAREEGKKVLMVDGDLRHRSLSRMLGARNQPGLAEHLKGMAELVEVVQRAPEGNLYLIGAGGPTDRAAELLQGNALRLAITQLARVFDWIVVDSPAALPVSDANILATVADGILVVARASSTNRDLVKKTKDMFPERLLGIVLNGVRRGDVYSMYEYPGYSTLAPL